VLLKIVPQALPAILLSESPLISSRAKENGGIAPGPESQLALQGANDEWL
jgi:hypothetical protein